MAMSYSYEMQAKVFDRMTELETQAAKPQFAVPQTLSQALRLAAELSDQKEQALLERDHAIATKAQIGSKREATAMATASIAARKVKELEVALDQSEDYATIKKMEIIHKTKFRWQELKKASLDLGIPAKDVPDVN